MQQLHGFVLGIIFGPFADEHLRQGNVSQNRQVREEVEMLKHHAHFLADFQAVLLVVVQGNAVDGDGAESISSSPFRHRKKVDFPDPDGPISTTTSLRRMFVEKSFSATTPLEKVLQMLSTRIM